MNPILAPIALGGALVLAAAGSPEGATRLHGSPEQGSMEAWVGCWALEHREDWAPNVNQAGYPSGSAAPAPRLLLLDRLPGLRSNLSGAQGARTHRAEWIGSALRGTEAWALRSDGNVYVENTPGVRVISAVLQGPPSEGAAPTMWFFRRTDSNLPEIRSLATARRVACPEGKSPHTTRMQDDLMGLLGGSVEGAFVHYDAGARRITRAGTAGDGGLPLGSGSARTTAWQQVMRLVDEASASGAETPLLEQGTVPDAGTGWIAGRRMGPDGVLHAFALHLHEAPEAWLAEDGELEERLEAILASLPGEG
jgi:hypothetical protein